MLNTKINSTRQPAMRFAEDSVGYCAAALDTVTAATSDAESAVLVRDCGLRANREGFRLDMYAVARAVAERRDDLRANAALASASAAELDRESQFPQLAGPWAHADYVIRRIEPGARIVEWVVDERAGQRRGRHGEWRQIWLKPVLWYPGEDRHELAGRRFREAWLDIAEIDARYSGPRSAAYTARDHAQDVAAHLNRVVGAV